MTERIAGARYAFRVAHPAAPMLRVRYRHGVPVDPWGFPDWTPYARTLVALPPVIAGLTTDEQRVVDVLAAERAARAGGDPVWTGEAGTPAGWTWAHLARTRHAALVPVELHASFRHLGGVSVSDGRVAGRGLTVRGGEPPRIVVTERLSGAAVVAVEKALGVPLPPAYRDFLARTNGGAPSVPVVSGNGGFVLDQPLFGVRDDRIHDLLYANAWFRDRLTPAWLAVGYLLGGLLTLHLGTGDVGWLDDDDPRDRDHFTASDRCARLMHRVAPDFTAFWTGLRPVPSDLMALSGGADEVHVAGLGALLPTSHRRPA